MDSFLCLEKWEKPVEGFFSAWFAGKEQLSSRWQAMPRKDALPRDGDGRRSAKLHREQWKGKKKKGPESRWIKR